MPFPQCADSSGPFFCGAPTGDGVSLGDQVGSCKSAGVHSNGASAYGFQYGRRYHLCLPTPLLPSV